MIVERDSKAINAFDQLCEGAGARLVGPRRAHISITVYGDGKREVGCGYLDRKTGNCQAGNGPCVHLYPIRQDLYQSRTENPDERPSEQAQVDRNYHAAGRTIEGREVGIWRDEDGREHAEYITGVHDLVFYELPDPIGPTSNFWAELNPKENRALNS